VSWWSNKQSLSCLWRRSCIWSVSFCNSYLVSEVRTKISIIVEYGIMYRNENGKSIGIISTAIRILSTICTWYKSRVEKTGSTCGYTI